MSGIDVRDLASEPLANGEFPAALTSDYRAYFSPEARAKMHAHATADVSVEICGVMVGSIIQDKNGPFMVVDDCICCNSATSKFAEVTFTHESWSQINEEMDTKFSDKQIVGWYHTHPNFGVFLSDRDQFIHEHFFSGAGQTAYVIDPIRLEEGLFIWKNGAPTALPYFWVGEELRVSMLKENSSPRSELLADRQESQPTTNAIPGGWSDDRSTPLLLLVLLSIIGFLVGNLYTRYSDSWQRQRLVEGVAAHYGNFKLIRLGLQEDLQVITDRLDQLALKVSSSLEDRGNSHSLTPKELAQENRMIRRGFNQSIDDLKRISLSYGFDEFERLALSSLITKKQAALGGAFPRQEQNLPRAEANMPNGVSPPQKTETPESPKNDSTRNSESTNDREKEPENSTPTLVPPAVELENQETSQVDLPSKS